MVCFLFEAVLSSALSKESAAVRRREIRKGVTSPMVEEKELQDELEEFDGLNDLVEIIPKRNGLGGFALKLIQQRRSGNKDFGRIELFLAICR